VSGLHHWILGGQRFPRRPIQPQRVAHAPGVHEVAFAPKAFGVALAVGLRPFRRDRIDRDTAFEQLLDRRALAGLDGHAQRGKRGQALAELLPAFRVVREPQCRDRLAARVEDHDLMVLLGPVEAGEVGELCKRFHAGVLSWRRRGR